MEHLEKMIEKVDHRMDKQDEKLEQILIQTTKTNGRVNALEGFKTFVYKVLWWVFLLMVALVTFLLERELFNPNTKNKNQYEQVTH